MGNAKHASPSGGPREKADIQAVLDRIGRRIRELRVFDLYFYGIDEDDPLGGTEHPARWCRYHDGPESEGRIGNLKERRTWAKLAATAGLPPGEFRKQFEYLTEDEPPPLVLDADHNGVAEPAPDRLTNPLA